MTYVDGDYYGLAVIIAARLSSHAGPGQVLVGEGATTAGKPKGVEFEAIGDVPLKGVERPVTVYRAMRSAASN